MGILLSIPAITYAVKKFGEIHNEINGQWFIYLYSLVMLWMRRRKSKTNRVMKHKIWEDGVMNSGIIPFDHEWEYDLPSKSKSEDILIYGVNSSKQSIKIDIKWRVNYEINENNESNNRKALISLRFDDCDGNYYTLDEESEVDYKKNEYKASGLTVEVLSPFRKKRIRFRGYLKKNGHQLVYVKFRFLWLSVSRVYDSTFDFNDEFIAKEWTHCKNRPNEQMFEDRLGQFGQMKGTFTEEDNPEKFLYFWGSIDKKYLETKPIERKIIRIVGYNKSGVAFELGLITNKNGLKYRFGILWDKMGAIKRLKSISLTNSDFEDLLHKSPNISFKAVFGEKEYKFEIKENKKSSANDLIVNGNGGMCYLLEENENEFQQKFRSVEKPLKDNSLVLGLNEENTKSVELSGGKGSSLAVLMSLSQQLVKENYENKFNVPNGIVVTTNAYQKLLDENKEILKQIHYLEKETQLSKEELRTKCLNLENSISKEKLPQIIGKEIENKLKQNFNNFENRLFAVRSSGASEDSEEMSAAGQMTTYLGVKGLPEIKQSVMKCWSSQFSHIAVEYKRGYGQPINSPMAVVIQEMVGCECAGVMFTCNPISGDERTVEITGNYGLGESVVSASSEPDTIRMSVNIESNSLSKRRTIAGIESKVIGAKKTLIKLSEDGGTVEEEVFDKEKCCISDEDLNRLADIGLKVHRHYGNARDIEWGLKGGQIFMLQSRPVTNLDNTFSEYEIMHEMDSSHQTEFEIYSRAHWGENFPGSSSWICLGWFWSNRQGFFRQQVSEGKLNEEDYNPYLETMGIQYNQIMFNLTNGVWDFLSEYPTTERSKQFILAMFGHQFTDEDVLQSFKERRERSKKKASFYQKMRGICLLIYNVIMGPTNLMKDKKHYIEEIKFDLVQLLKKASDSKQMFDIIIDNFYNISNTQMKNHGPVSMGSNIKNGILKNTLAKALENNPHLDDDFNLMTSSCEDVISAEVPNILREIAVSIKDKNAFLQMSDEEALKLLKEGNDESSQKFEHFLERHGHRGYRELDPMHPPWRDNPIPCIKTIKGMLSGSETQLVPKVVKSVDEVINELKTPLSFTRKLVIKKLLLPWSRRGVGYREHSKYFMIWMNDKQRQGFRYLAQQMVREGLIPSEDLFFYLTVTEVMLLCNGDRDPMINMRARLRKRYYPKMNKYKFEEFTKGPEMKPRNFEDQIITNIPTGAVKMSGTPVSSGTVKARVCVAEDITDADSIQSGDILITYSTDIGWSPYFPLLSGIITEIGGTISHGAVIAREYGIPSLIAVEGACRAFKTGDICVLDTKSATITKVE